MTEEDYFRKNYPDSCYGDRPLSPHWDFFQDGVEFGERQSEKRIAELEAQLKTVSLKIISCIKAHLCKQDEDYDKAIISPKFLSDVLDQMAADGFEEINEK